MYDDVNLHDIKVTHLIARSRAWKTKSHLNIFRWTAFPTLNVANYLNEPAYFVRKNIAILGIGRKQWDFILSTDIFHLVKICDDDKNGLTDLRGCILHGCVVGAPRRNDVPIM